MIYNVDQALEKLKYYKITSNKESLRRWLRNGTITGIPPASRKEGWKIKETDLWAFIQQRVPEETLMNNNTTNVVKEGNYREFVRAEMWWELVRKNLFEGSVELKKKDLQLFINEKKFTQEVEDELWELISEHSWQAHPRIFYLHDAFLFQSQRIKMDTKYGDSKERILRSLIKYLYNRESK
ncbi:hypothetical protein [Halobacillus massiliensis]|uniref:hypothetical protein n=1 Tax=Halobacillus massiliensis TaxID=1926286 RepID=UPI0009E4E4A1|nr:hypothetical protein [Halobacillus massiliensis]